MTEPLTHTVLARKLNEQAQQRTNELLGDPSYTYKKKQDEITSVIDDLLENAENSLEGMRLHEQKLYDILDNNDIKTIFNKKDDREFLHKIPFVDRYTQRKRKKEAKQFVKKIKKTSMADIKKGEDVARKKAGKDGDWPTEDTETKVRKRTDRFFKARGPGWPMAPGELMYLKDAALGKEERQLRSATLAGVNIAAGAAPARTTYKDFIFVFGDTKESRGVAGVRIAQHRGKTPVLSFTDEKIQNSYNIDLEADFIKLKKPKIAPLTAENLEAGPPVRAALKYKKQSKRPPDKADLYRDKIDGKGLGHQYKFILLSKEEAKKYLLTQYFIDQDLEMEEQQNVIAAGQFVGEGGGAKRHCTKRHRPQHHSKKRIHHKKRVTNRRHATKQRKKRRTRRA